MLDRRRLEDAHFQYAILKVASWYPSSFKLTDLPLHGATRETLLQMSDSYYGAFMKKYSGKHNVTMYTYRLDTEAKGSTRFIYSDVKFQRQILRVLCLKYSKDCTCRSHLLKCLTCLHSSMLLLSNLFTVYQTC